MRLLLHVENTGGSRVWLLASLAIFEDKRYCEHAQGPEEIIKYAQVVYVDQVKGTAKATLPAAKMPVNAGSDKHTVPSTGERSIMGARHACHLFDSHCPWLVTHVWWVVGKSLWPQVNRVSETKPFAPHLISRGVGRSAH